MQPHIELESTRSQLVAAGEHFWGWEIPVYLFLGGLVAGLMLTVSVVILTRGKERVTDAMRLGLIAAPVLLSLGMLALFLDLTLKLHVFRFYLTLRPYAPMSLGSWVLLIVYPIQLLLVLALPWPGASGLIDRFKRRGRLQAFAARHLGALAWAGVAGGVALGVYTGVLLATTVAHPLWSSGVLGFLFLTSGASTGVALMMLFEKEQATQAMFARADIGLIVLELTLLGSWIVGLATAGPIYRQAVAVVLTGRYAPAFLGFVLFGGLLLPALLELLALRGRAVHSRTVPALVLLGGLILRFVIVYAGQQVHFYVA